MRNGLDVPQGILLVGGTSDIGRAILAEVCRPGVSRVVTLSRDTAAAQAACRDLESRRPETDWQHRRVDLEQCVEASSVVEDVICDLGDVDLAILAAAELTRDDTAPPKAADVARVVTVNMASLIAVMDTIADSMVAQGSGTIVVLSTVAMERVRPANALYGATKAGLDAYAQALDHRVAGTGVRVLVVRPGFVTSKMTEGLAPAPFAATPERVAVATRRAIRRGRRVVWAPPVLRWVFMIFRHMPTFLWRRLPL